MAGIRPIDQSADKWQRRASVAGDDYVRGLNNPRRPWAAAAQAADPTYRQAVTAAANAGKYASGIKRVGDTKWLDGAVSKGPGRYAEGVQLGQGAWVAGFTPYADAIKALTLPVRGPKGSAANLQRVQVVDAALRAVKDRLG